MRHARPAAKVVCVTSLPVSTNPAKKVHQGSVTSLFRQLFQEKAMPTTSRTPARSASSTRPGVASIVFSFCLLAAVVSPAQTLTTLASFNGANGAGALSLVQGTDGNFYGTTQVGGANNIHCSTAGCGTVFKITLTGTLTTLYSFCAQGGNSCPDGDLPYAGLVQGADGNFYGTTAQGGANCADNNGCGTVFKITATGTLTTLYSFSGAPDGAEPFGALVQGADGNFYGTTALAGVNSAGTVFKITPAGTLTTLYSFCAQSGCADGQYPYAGLVQGADGNFYGTTYSGGIGNNGPSGTVFKISSTGQLTTLHSFCANGQAGGCPDGYYPYSALVQALDGNFYGTASGGGAHDLGIVFKISPTGTLTTLYSFTGQADGAAPHAGLVPAADGNFYGTTLVGGTGNGGTIFGVTSTGVLVALHGFCSQPQCQDGGGPLAGVMQSTSGSFYGTTGGGGADNHGTVYSFNTGLTPFVLTQPASGAVGAAVTILGTNLTGATGVTFNGTTATILTNTGSAITTTVPLGATSGTVQVALPGGTLSTTGVFQVNGPFQFVAVTPCRLLDTRQNGGPIPGGTTESFIVPSSGGCGIPTSAAAYSLNVTVSPHGPLGYLTIWPEGEIQPYVSTMNSLDGRIKANAVIVPASNNAVSVYVTDTTDVILDINGYFTAQTLNNLQFFPLPPCRVVDTRGSNGPLGGPRLEAQQERDFPVLSSTCFIPNGIGPVAYSLNFTAIPNPRHQPLGYLTVWATGSPQPPTSTLNNPTATVVANAAIVDVGNLGDIAVYPSDTTDLLIDINGYFAIPWDGGYPYYPVSPCRAFDSRNNNGHPFTGEIVVPIATSPCAPPANAAGYVFNATVVPTSSLGYLTLWPDQSQSGQPVVSTLNAYDGFITSNMAIVQNLDGSTDAFAGMGNPGPGSGYTQLILDISGYFAP
jgi:uncharacterized repeat protein (TIGR03803 family)